MKNEFHKRIFFCYYSTTRKITLKKERKDITVTVKNYVTLSNVVHLAFV